ncbi:hypothetical protein CGGC5_v011028 [Colletotrichum fructicola Nara gc5]|uniref:Uncharacterized protein n=1 Tax=Colletotrichum fructicola (strain Nara gc5) TaxID=1213859 RepID=A0A7J6IV63_COLFN|nr:hypothetical protein CFRS1_v015342 [Colletotrichum fructicola]KAF4480470.1 hypothetical protein CGGC5_v011028 [Colletotrichum fructicola Nara gc5]KAF4894862.1 hypothetical protein CGCFRS4_v006240 [Colletotrichum fructicola]
MPDAACSTQVLPVMVVLSTLLYCLAPCPLSRVPLAVPPRLPSLYPVGEQQRRPEIPPVTKIGIQLGYWSRKGRLCLAEGPPSSKDALVRGHDGLRQQNLLSGATDDDGLAYTR